MFYVLPIPEILHVHVPLHLLAVYCTVVEEKGLQAKKATKKR